MVMVIVVMVTVVMVTVVRVIHVVVVILEIAVDLSFQRCLSCWREHYHSESKT